MVVSMSDKPDYSDETTIPEYPDLIVFLDDNNQKQEIFVRVLDVSNLITFQMKSGNVISIPPSRLLKLKRKGEHYGQ